MTKVNLGSIFVLICMLIRSTDVFFRYTALKIVSATQLIFFEHLIACLFLIFFIKQFRLIKLSLKEWFFLIFISCGTSVGGILFFTLAFSYINPSVVILFQKLQPLVTIFFAFFVLGERKSYKFFLLSFIALLSSYLLAFEFTFPTVQLLKKSEFTGIVFSLLSVFFWGLGTVFGKSLLIKMNTFQITFYRYYLGLVFSGFLVLLTEKNFLFKLSFNKVFLFSVSYMALFPGLLSLFLYYLGLKKVSASTASILELFFPVCSVIIVWVFLDKPLSLVQIIAGITLLISIFCVSVQKN